MQRLTWILGSTFAMACDGAKPAHSAAPSPPPPASAGPAAAPPSPAQSTSQPAPTVVGPSIGPTVHFEIAGKRLAIEAPPCARVLHPMPRIPANAHEVFVTCEADTSKPVFAVQVGPAADKIGRAEIANELDFKHFTSQQPDLLQWDREAFGQTIHEFQLRTRIDGEAYACFPQFGSSDEGVFAQMLIACQTLRGG